MKIQIFPRKFKKKLCQISDGLQYQTLFCFLNLQKVYFLIHKDFMIPKIIKKTLLAENTVE